MSKQQAGVPNYFLAALKKNQRASDRFDKLSYSHQREYVKWITEAKREETRDRRIKTTLQWLTQGKSRNSN
jgi:uncharacterized protein YdeI (YjbR/CyaY-like superfamily)